MVPSFPCKEWEYVDELFSLDGSEWIEGGGVISGSSDEQGSYCSDLGG